jgi:glycopeptide antibiotics resistance protein
MGASLFLGGLMVSAIEIAQLALLSHASSTTDLITGTLGVALGAAMARRLWNRWPEEQPGVTSWPRTTAWLMAAAFHAVLLTAFFILPSGPAVDPGTPLERFEGFFSVPFARLLECDPFHFPSEILRKFALWAPLGLLLGLATHAMPATPGVGRAVRWAVVPAVALMALAIEMAQVYFPPHVPDVTDVLLAALGAGAALRLTTWAVNQSRAGSTLWCTDDSSHAVSAPAETAVE